MERAAETGLSERLPLEELVAVFEREPVRLALCFGSRATGRTHDHSDIDLAVELEGLRPGDEGYNDAFFGLYAEVTGVLGREDVDLVDIHSLSGSLARAVFETGVLLYGDPERVPTLEAQVDTERDDRPPRERLDSAIERIDEHLA